MTSAANLTLYLMLGYPGAGKTTAARLISHLTGAQHLWADQQRRELFGAPTYSEQENDQLYDRMNQQAADLLASGRSVVFDTGFNLRSDRDHLRAIATSNGATTILIWITLEAAVARQRATHDAHLQTSRTLGNMSNTDFERLKQKLQPPDNDELYLELNGASITTDYVAEQLHAHHLL